MLTPRGPGEDAFKAVGMAAVMEKAGCPIPAEMQQLVERALDFYHWVWSSPDFWGETVKHGETW